MEQWYLYKKKADFNQIGEKFNIDPVIARLIRNRDVVGDEQYSSICMENFQIFQILF